MEREKKFPWAYAALLVLTLAFLGALAWLSARGNAAPDGGYTVAPERAASAEALVPESEPVNVNTASAEELEQLTGIGPALARAIVAYREEHGRFASVEELTNVSGIGEAKLSAIRDSVTLGEEDTG